MNLKFLKTISRYAVAALAVGFLFVLAGCEDDDEPPQNQDPTESIMEIVSGNPDLSELAAYLEAYPDLQALLSGTTEYTLFAPTDDAFASLYATPGFPADPADISPDLIKGVIAYHIVAGKLLKEDLTPTGTGAGIATLYDNTNPCTGAETNQVIRINDDGTLKTGSTTTNIMISDEDNEATNGVVHVVASVLIPPSVGETLTPILGKLVATVLLGADFKYLAQAMVKADCGITGSETPLSNILADPDNDYTAFLPPDAVFEGTAAAQSITVAQLIGNFTAAQWRSIILNHIAPGTYALEDLTNGTEIVTLLNPATPTELTVTDVTAGAPPTGSPVGKVLGTSGGATGLGGTTNSPIYQADIPASNGVAHVIGKILFPN